DLQHIIDAPHDPEVSILVAVGAVARDVVAVVELLPVAGDVTVVVAPDGAQHRRPGLVDHEVAARVGTSHGPAIIVDDIGVDTGQRLGAGARLGGGYAGKWRDQDRSGLGLPPGIDDRTPASADHPVIPHPRLGVDWLANAAEQAQL